MGGDYSRERFDPRNDFSGVLMQQGRVQLDADWNDWVRLLDRRLRAETVDIIGRHTVGGDTPDGFKIGIVNGGLTIGLGRIYVDGLLAENHGLVAKIPGFDAVLAEPRGEPSAVPYNNQPYPGDDKFLSEATAGPTAGGPYLVYLDVWQREVTGVEHPKLIEQAVGVDTTTRMQTAWQVRTLEVDGAVMCDTDDKDIPKWLERIRPSDGRLSTEAVGVADSPKKCIIPPNAGFGGMENRLYRVEIHNGGSAGTATFKWSRDNASLATAVIAIAAPDQLTVASLGRDAIFSFGVGDWIEITDDWLEYAHKPGLIRRIKAIDPSTNIVTLTAALTAGIFSTSGPGNSTNADRHTRVRRWEQQGKVFDTNNNLVTDIDNAPPGAEGPIAVPQTGTSIILEDGVKITFDTPAGGIYRTGDFWNFAARTADTSVEILTKAPPLGVHHHYCRLAVVKFNPDVITDCRHLWPPQSGSDCECAACVTDHSHNSGALTIQRAIDQVKSVGGTVCLGPGTYELGQEAIRIIKARSLRVRGSGVATVLRYVGSGPALIIDSSFSVTLEDVMLVAVPPDDNASAVVIIQKCVSVTIQRNCVLRSMRAAAERFASPGIGLMGILAGIIIRENFIFAPVGVGNPRGRQTQDNLAAARPDFAPLATAELIIQDNTLVCSERGISLDGACVNVLQTRLSGNLIADSPLGAIVARGFVHEGSSLDVQANEIYAAGQGIWVGVDNARIVGNDVRGMSAELAGNGIVLGGGLDASGMDHCHVLTNRITNFFGNGIAITGIIASAMIKQNYIDGARLGGIVMDDNSHAVQITIENNQLVNIGPDRGSPEREFAAVRIVNAMRSEITNNLIRDVGAGEPNDDQVPRFVAIKVISLGTRAPGTVNPSAFATVRVTGNEVFNIGPQGGAHLSAAGIEFLGRFAAIDVTDNSVRRNLDPKADDASFIALNIRAIEQQEPAPLAGGIWFIKLPAAPGEPASNLALAIIGNQIWKLRPGREQIGVHGNRLDTHGSTSNVVVETTGIVTFTNNRCQLVLAEQFQQQAVVMETSAGLVSNNYVKGTKFSMLLKVPRDIEHLPLTVLGNITSGRIIVLVRQVEHELPPPWDKLNIII